MRPGRHADRHQVTAVNTIAVPRSLQRLVESRGEVLAFLEMLLDAVVEVDAVVDAHAHAERDHGKGRDLQADAQAWA